MTASPGKLLNDFTNDVVAHLKDSRGYCLCCSLDVAYWPVDDRFAWMQTCSEAEPCERCPSVAASGDKATLARRRMAWLVLSTQMHIRAAKRRQGPPTILSNGKEELDVRGSCPPMPGDPQPHFWTKEAQRGC